MNFEFKIVNREVSIVHTFWKWESDMQYTILGKTGFKVSKLGLGGAPVGGDFGGSL